MRIKDASSETEEPINMTSMMDMVFNLLIFFLVASTLAQEERDMKINLPSTATSKALSAPPEVLIVNIREDGSVKVGTEEVDRGRLRQLFHTVANEDAKRNVLIRCDKRADFEHYAGVVDLAQAEGIAETRIGYLKDK
jgi:biopolymer transport protein ExbD